MKIIITGGLGFIGSNLINKLKLHNEIIVFDNLSTNIKDKIDAINIMNIDLADESALHAVNIDSVDIVIHLAGPSSGPASAKFPQETLDQSNKVTFNILKFCERLSIKRILFASSMAVYGDPKYSPVNEESVCQPISYYGIAKLSSEYIIQAFSKATGLEYSILRLFNIYGPGQDLSRMDQGLVSIYLSMLINKNPFVIKGKLDRIRDLIHIDDIVNSVNSIMGSINGKNQVINICNGDSITIERLARLLIEHFENYSFDDIIEEEGSPGDTHQIYGDNRKLLELIGFKSAFDIETGIQNFVQWAKEYY